MLSKYYCVRKRERCHLWVKVPMKNKHFIPIKFKPECPMLSKRLVEFKLEKNFNVTKQNNNKQHSSSFETLCTSLSFSCFHRLVVFNEVPFYLFFTFIYHIHTSLLTFHFYVLLSWAASPFFWLFSQIITPELQDP